MARDSIATLPNLVSMSRLVMAALFPFVPGNTPRLALIAAAGVTDFLDGYLARKRGSTSHMGEMIDPFADRCFLIVAVFVLWGDDVLSIWQTLVVAVRDISLLVVWIGVRLTGHLKTFGFIARPSGKVLTVLQLATLALAYIAPQWIGIAVVIVGIASLATIADYCVALWRTRAKVAVLVLTFGAAAAATPCAAQAQVFTFAPTVQPELSAAATFGNRTSAAAGVGINVPAGYYVRVAEAISFGRELTGARPGNVLRAEVVARFLTDPFGESRWGPYGGGGAAVDWRDGSAGRVALMLVAGTELPSKAAWRPGIEIAVGNGVRLSLIIRRARTAGR